MRIDRCTRDDFLEILDAQESFWGSSRAAPLHHPVFIEEFGDTAFAARDGGVLCGYLFGFFAQIAPGFYIHLVAVRDGYRGRGVGRMLYRHAEAIARDRGAAHLKAITTPGNAASLAFHRSLGFLPEGAGGRDAAAVVADYAGRGAGRVVLTKRL